MARRGAMIVGMLAILGTLPGCMPGTEPERFSPAVVAEWELPPIRIVAPPVMMEGKTVVAGGPVVVRAMARRYSSGSVYYEIKSIVSAAGADFGVKEGRTERMETRAVPPADEASTRLVEAHRRTVTEYDLVQVHVALEIERTDASGTEHPPRLIVVCRTELWGTQRVFVGERRMEARAARWGEVEERMESSKRVGVESDAVEAWADVASEWLMVEKGEAKGPHPMRRGVGHRTVVVKRGAGGG